MATFQETSKYLLAGESITRTSWLEANDNDQLKAGFVKLIRPEEGSWWGCWNEGDWPMYRYQGAGSYIECKPSQEDLEAVDWISIGQPDGPGWCITGADGIRDDIWTERARNGF